MAIIRCCAYYDGERVLVYLPDKTSGSVSTYERNPCESPADFFENLLNSISFQDDTDMLDLCYVSEGDMLQLDGSIRGTRYLCRKEKWNSESVKKFLTTKGVLENKRLIPMRIKNIKQDGVKFIYFQLFSGGQGCTTPSPIPKMAEEKVLKNSIPVIFKNPENPTDKTAMAVAKSPRELFQIETDRIIQGNKDAIDKGRVAGLALKENGVSDGEDCQ